VPNDARVELTYGRTGVEWLAYALTLLGVIGLVVLARRPLARFPGGTSDDGDEDTSRTGGFESDGSEIDVQESDGFETEVYDTDVRESDGFETDVYETDAYETDVYETDVYETDGFESGGFESDLDETDVHGSEHHEGAARRPEDSARDGLDAAAGDEREIRD
jgi:hypothetical protein